MFSLALLTLLPQLGGLMGTTLKKLKPPDGWAGGLNSLLGCPLPQPRDKRSVSLPAQCMWQIGTSVTNPAKRCIWATGLVA
jgi:hypothetical protein